MERLEEVLELRIEDGLLNPEDVMPALLVSARPRYQETEGWFGTRAIEVMQRSFGEDGLRVCEACMAPRAYALDGNLVYQTGPISIEEVKRLDDLNRGDGAAAKSAVWIDELRTGVSIKIIDLATSQVIFASNIDPNFIEKKNTKRMYKLAEEYERRARGDSLTQAFVDVGMYPGQHISFDWTDQWGKRNQFLTGVTISLFDPLLGIGISFATRIKLLNIALGSKVIISLPTALIRSFGNDGITDGEVFDPLLTATAFARVPVPLLKNPNYGLFVSISTNGEFGLGVSLLNINLLPFLP